LRGGVDGGCATDDPGVAEDEGAVDVAEPADDSAAEGASASARDDASPDREQPPIAIASSATIDRARALPSCEHGRTTPVTSRDLPSMSSTAAHPHAARLAHPEVMAKVKSLLPARIQVADRDEVLQKTFLRMLLLPELPPTHDGLLGMCVVMTNRVLVDELRRGGRARRRHADADAIEEAGGIAEPSTGLAAEKLSDVLEYVERRVRKGDYPEIVLEAVRLLLEGHSYDATAEKVGVPPGTLRSTMSRVWVDVRKHWPTASAIAAVVGAVLFALFATPRPEPEIGAPPEPPPSSTARPDAGPEPQMPPETWRDAARAACNENGFELCEHDLDQAKALDPDGEFRPEVQRMREEIRQWHRRTQDYRRYLLPGDPSALPQETP
jgi:DNA-directed RNA polymerase specialized sigma24 family protein